MLRLQSSIFIASLVVSATAWPALGHAQVEPSTQPSLPVVRVLLHGSDARTSAIQTALLDPFKRARLALRFERVAALGPGQLLKPPQATDDSAACLALDLSRPNQITLYLSDRSRSRIFVRRFETAGASDEVTQEQLVVAARSSVEAILAGESIGVARQEYERSLQQPEPARATPPRRPAPPSTVSIASRYEAEWLAGTEPSHGPGLMVSWVAQRFGVGGSLGSRLPRRFTQGEIGLRLITLSASLAAELHQELTPAWAVVLTAGIGLDFTRVQPLELRAAAADVASPSWVLDPVWRAQLGVSRRLGRVYVNASGGIDVAWFDARYTVDRQGQREALLVPRLVRPLLAISFGTSF